MPQSNDENSTACVAIRTPRLLQLSRLEMLSRSVVVLSFFEAKFGSSHKIIVFGGQQS